MCDSDTALILISIQTLISVSACHPSSTWSQLEVEILTTPSDVPNFEIIHCTQVFWDTSIKINNSCPIKYQQFIITSPADLNLPRVNLVIENLFENEPKKTKTFQLAFYLAFRSILFNQRI